MEEIFRKCAISDNMTPEDAGLKITGKQEVFSRSGGGGGGGGGGRWLLKKGFILECFAPRSIMFQGLCHFPCFQSDLNNLSS